MLADGKSHGAERADGREVHKDGHHPEDRMGNRIQQREKWPATLTHHRQGETKEDSYQQHLEMSPLAKASTMVVGMMCITKSVALFALAAPA